MTLMMYRAQLSSRGGGSMRVIADVDSCSVETCLPRPEVGMDESGVAGLDPGAGLLPREFGLVSSARDPQRDAIASARTLRRKSWDWRMSTPRNPAPSICCNVLLSCNRDIYVGSATHLCELL